jgi:predicted GIY-YIG superfamily endonuclease
LAFYVYLLASGKHGTLYIGVTRRPGMTAPNGLV